MNHRLALPFTFLLFSAPIFAATDATEVAGVRNFHQIDTQVYRGAQPTSEGFQSLAKLGIKTIIDLRGTSGRSTAEKKTVESLGMKYISIPLRGHSAPTDQNVTRLLALLNDAGGGPVFVHCRRGADRTGTVIACYRITHDHWANDKALHEARACGMSWTELAMQRYVRQYSKAALPVGAVITSN